MSKVIFALNVMSEPKLELRIYQFHQHEGAISLGINARQINSVPIQQFYLGHSEYKATFQ